MTLSAGVARSGIHGAGRLRRHDDGRARLRLAALAIAMVGAMVGAILTAPANGRVAAPPRVYGLAVPGAPTDLTALDAATSAVGVAPGQVAFYTAWAYGGDFPASAAAAIAGRGAVPELVWEPWDPSAGTNQPAYSLATIAAGTYDGYLARWAREIKTYGAPVVIRFAHEMNTDWYPWSESANGNRPGAYVAAWRHVVGLFSAAKVKNVSWEWAPNVPQGGSVPLAQLYPGDGYVQRVALDGYNWGTSQSWSSWQSFADVFGSGVAQLVKLSSRPIYVAETASAEAGGSKAAWISDMWTWLSRHPEVRGVTWFDVNKETDWRIDSTEASLTAFRAGLSGFLTG